METDATGNIAFTLKIKMGSKHSKTWKVSAISNPNIPIIDNIDKTVGSFLNEKLPMTRCLKVGVGYFYLGGFYVIKNNCQQLQQFLILMGNETDQRTGTEIGRGYIERIIKERLKQEIDATVEDTDAFEGLLELHSLIKQGICDVHIYTQRPFHAKLYLLSNHDEAMALTGSSNFSTRGLGGQLENTNIELNLLTTDNALFTRLNDWYDTRYAEAQPFSVDLLNYIESSPSFKRYIQRTRDPDYITPFELYKLLMYHFLDGDITIHRDALVEFQKIGVENAKEKIKNLSGVIISDSVGLGKSFIGAELITSALKRNERTLLIIPASKDETQDWNFILKEYFGLAVNDGNVDIVTIEKFSRYSREEIVHIYGDYDLIVVDEAHRFRNPDSKSLKNLAELKGRTIVLITATPLNNSITDLKSLIFSFATPISLTNMGLNPTAFEQYEQISKQMELARKRGIDITPYRQSLDAPLQGINAILNHTMILRTRTTIKQRYPNLMIGGVPVKFATPTVRKITYDLGTAWEPVLDRLVNFIFDLALPHIMVLNQTASHMLRELFKITMLKRFESSPLAFSRSLNNIIQTEQRMLHEIKKQGLATILKERIAKRLDLEDDDAINEVLDQDWSAEDLDQGVALFDAGMQHDIDAITVFKDTYFNTIKNGTSEFSFVDAKLTKLLEIIDHSTGKILIFTQFRDTAEYLYHHLSRHTSNVEILMGGDPDRKDKIVRFCPKSNPVNGKTLTHIENESNIMIATDTLSESVNLQDCRIVINYDLHWNPMRIVQRVGRIDRIGNDDPYTVYNFFPSAGVQRYLKLLEKIKAKITNITQVVGKEFGILEETEEVNIKTIGERITHIENIQTIDDYEKIASNPILKLEGEEERDRIRNEMRTRLKKDGITEDKFKTFSKPKYSIFKSTGGTLHGLIALYKVIDKKNNRTLQTLLLHTDAQGTVRPISPLEIYVTDGTRGMTKDALYHITPNVDIPALLTLSHSTAKKIVATIKKNYTDSMISRRIPKMSKIQNAVKQRLFKDRDLISIDPQATVWRKKIRDLSYKYSLTIFSPDTAHKLKVTLDQYGSLNDIATPRFIAILENFFTTQVKTNAEYDVSLMRIQDIACSHICWGWMF